MLGTEDIHFIRNDCETQEDFYKNFLKCGRSPFKILLRIYKGSYWVLVKSFLFYIIQNIPVLVWPICVANIINVVTYSDEHSYGELVLNAIVLLVCIGQNVLSTFLATKNRSIANRRAEFNLRSALARKLQMLSMGFHKEMESGKLQSKMMRDVECIQDFINTLTQSILYIILILGTSVVVTLSKSKIVFLFFLVAVPCAVFLMFLFRKIISQKNSVYRHEVESTSARSMEMIEMIPITKAHSLENVALRKFGSQLEKMAGAAYSLDKTTALFGSSSYVVFNLLQAICLLYTGTLAYKKIIPIGDITLYHTYFGTIVGAVNNIISLMPLITRGVESVKSVGDIMWSEDIENLEGKEVIGKLDGGYEFENVAFHYQDDPKKVLNGVNLKIQKGETIALVGESGSGKTTIINMIIGFYKPTAGTLWVDGKDMSRVDLHSYRSHIATVPQVPVLFSGSIRDNILFGMEKCTEEQLNEAIRIANLQDVIDKMPNGLDTKVGEHGGKLSGGQRQRIAIARAVIRDAQVILFDEATSALDTVSERLIQDSIEKLSEGRTTFIVAHRLSTIRNADKIAVIKDGICVEYGTWDELLAQKGEFYRFRELQI